MKDFFKNIFSIVLVFCVNIFSIVLVFCILGGLYKLLYDYSEYQQKHPTYTYIQCGNIKSSVSSGWYLDSESNRYEDQYGNTFVLPSGIQCTNYRVKSNDH